MSKKRASYNYDWFSGSCKYGMFHWFSFSQPKIHWSQQEASIPYHVKWFFAQKKMTQSCRCCRLMHNLRLFVGVQRDWFLPSNEVFWSISAPGIGIPGSILSPWNPLVHEEILNSWHMKQSLCSLVGILKIFQTRFFSTAQLLRV